MNSDPVSFFMKTTSFEHLPYRKNVALVILNRKREILLVVRAGNDEVWQFPQGGVREHESLENAVLRETAEELGISNVRILGRSSKMHEYLWPSDVVAMYDYRFKGQKQSIWFLFFEGTDFDIRIDRSEIGSYKWVLPNEVEDIIDPKRLELAKKILSDYKKFEKKVTYLATSDDTLFS
jgi:putative (di)nucleoside polyphosphate hydrolase